MIRGLAIAGDAFWILALALMASFTFAAWKRIPADARAPVLWKGMTPTMRAPRWAALLALPAATFLIGAWLQVVSRTPGFALDQAFIGLGVRITLAPLLVLLHLGRVQRTLQILEAEGGLNPPPSPR